jgi:hypothetical protein
MTASFLPLIAQKCRALLTRDVAHSDVRFPILKSKNVVGCESNTAEKGCRCGCTGNRGQRLKFLAVAVSMVCMFVCFLCTLHFALCSLMDFVSSEFLEDRIRQQKEKRKKHLSRNSEHSGILPLTHTGLAIIQLKLVRLTLILISSLSAAPSRPRETGKNDHDTTLVHMPSDYS